MIRQINHLENAPEFRVHIKIYCELFFILLKNVTSEINFVEI